MSDFLCGKLTFTHKLSIREQAELSFDLVRYALDQRLGLQVGCAIVQPIVFEILGCGRELNGIDVPFLITDSPIWDASDEIISKYPSDHLDADAGESLQHRLERVQRFLIASSRVQPVQQITVVLGQGYDDTYEEVTGAAADFVAKIAPRYEDVLEVPSVKFIVTPLRTSG